VEVTLLATKQWNKYLPSSRNLLEYSNHRLVLSTIEWTHVMVVGENGQHLFLSKFLMSLKEN